MKNATVTFKNGKTLGIYDGKFFGVEVSTEPCMKGQLDYYAMIHGFCDAMILNNEIIRHADDWEVVNGSDHDEETGEYFEVFQYFIIDGNGAEYLEEYTDQLVYYSESLDMYLLGVTHCGTAWDCVNSGYEVTAEAE